MNIPLVNECIFKWQVLKIFQDTPYYQTQDLFKDTEANTFRTIENDITSFNGSHTYSLNTSIFLQVNRKKKYCDVSV